MKFIRKFSRSNLLWKFWQDFRFPLLVFLFWRVWLFLLSYIAIYLLPFKESFPYVRYFLSNAGFPQWVWQWGNFDGVHYLNISINGYRDLGLQAFFSVYPELIYWLSAVTHNHLLSALLISNITFLAAIFLFYRLLLRKFGKKVAVWSVLFMICFPTSYYFGAVYTESLFFLFLLISISDSGLISGLSSSLAGGTRLIGNFLAAFPLLEKPRNWWNLAAPLGLLGYMAFLYYRFGNPLLFLSAQTVFGNARAGSLSSLVTPFQVIFRYLKIFTTANPAHYDYFVAALEFSSFLFVVVLLGILTLKKKLPYSYLAYGWLSILLPTFSGTFSSMPRYILTVFPVYIGLAMIKNSKVKVLILFASAALLSVLTILFTRGYWVS